MNAHGPRGRRSGLTAVGVAMAVALFSAALLVAAGGDTRVADAAMRGDRQAVRALLKQGASVNASQGDGMTALHWAASKDDMEMAQLLVSGGANPKAITRLGGLTPLYMAAQNGDARLVARLHGEQHDVLLGRERRAVPGHFLAQAPVDLLGLGRV